jgi:glycosyltransferase involved in cell wall biosynthesis
MKVAFIASDAAGLDGWGRYTAELVGALRSLDVEPVLITAGSVGEALTDLPHYPILPGPFEGIGTTPRSLLLVPKVRRIVADCNLIHCMTEHYMPLAALVSGGKPLVMLAHGTWAVRPLARRWLGWLFRWAIRRADLVIGASRYTLDRMAHYVSLRRTLVRSGGVRIDDFARPVAWRPPAWAKGARVALGVGAIKARKGYHVAIEAVREALDELPNLHYVIVGGLEHAPGYVAQLREQIERLGLAGRIHLLGRVPFDELVGWYQCADVLLLVPVNIGDSFEGFGLVYLEAGAASTPSIGSSDCGAAEAILDGKNGLLVPQNDPSATAGALVRALGDPDWLRRAGQAARDHAALHTWEVVAADTLAAYRCLRP